MTKPLKIVVLVVTLALPVVIYLFLQAFGENMYALPVYPEQQVSTDSCGSVAPGYTISELVCRDKSVVVLGDEQNYLFHFPGSSMRETAGEMNEMRRLVEETEGLNYKLVTFSNEQQYEKWNGLASSAADTSYWIVTAACSGFREQVLNCQLLGTLADLKKGASESMSVLVDARGRVRGFYATAQKSEIDRLLVELDVLMQEK